jgi:outer membrane protein
MKKTIITLALAAAVATVGAQASTTKIGVVNFMHVFAQAPQGKSTLDKLKSAMKPRIDKLKTEQQSLVTSLKALNRDAPTMTKTARAAKEKTLDAQQKSFQKEVVGLRGSEMKEEHAAAKSFETAIKAAVKSVATKGSYSLILSSQAAPYVTADLNVTSQVVSAMKAAK